MLHDQMMKTARDTRDDIAAVGSRVDRAIGGMLDHADARNMNRALDLLTRTRIVNLQQAARGDVDTPDHAGRVSRRAMEYGGSFAHAWGEAVHTALHAEDWPTLHSLRDYFPDLWAEYADDRWDR